MSITRPERGESDKAYREANKARRNAYDRAWRSANLARDKERKKEYVKANAERERLRHAVYGATHPEVVANKNHRRRILDSEAQLFVITERDWRRLCARHGDACAYCKRKTKLTRDHVVPVSRGGRHSIGNLLPACISCNSSKRAQFLIEWRCRERTVA